MRKGQLERGNAGFQPRIFSPHFDVPTIGSRQQIELHALQGGLGARRGIGQLCLIFACHPSGKVLAWSSETGQLVDPVDAPARPQRAEARFPDGFRRALALSNADVYVAGSRSAHWNAWPLFDAAERHRYHGEKAQECQANGEWFAAAFHLCGGCCWMTRTSPSGKTAWSKP